MYISLEQILIASCAVAALQSVLMLVTWLQDRSATWLLWMCALFITGGLSLFLYLLDGHLWRPLSIGLGTETFILAFFLIWSAVRSFEQHQVHWPLAFTALAGWALVCFTPGMLDNYVAAAIALSGLGALGVGAAALELWQGRRKQNLVARWLMFGLLAVVAVSFAVRVPFLMLMPFPFGGQPMEPQWTAAFVLSLVLAAVILSFVSIMLAKERAGVELRQYALTDALTGLPNRRAFAVDAAHVARGHLQSKTGYCLVMFDIDHFKTINDSHGHDFGDTVLRVFAEIGRKTLPDGNAFYRVGGEEFCAILAETGEADAVKAADAFRVAFRSTSVLHGGRSVEVTVSAGVGSSLDAGIDPAKVQILADTALYRAKRLGRDRVCAGTQEPVADFDIGWSAA